MAATVKGLAQVALTVGDLEGAKTFYGAVLGLPHLFDASPALAFFQAGATRLMLSASEDEASVRTILYYAIEDVAAAFEAMKQGGAEFEQEPRVIAQLEGRDVWLAVTSDGQGNLVGLISG